MQENQLQNLNLLIMKVASGDENAFEALFKFYDSQLNAYIMTITKSQPLTEEMVQDVFLKIWLNRESLTEIDSFRSYLFVMARNHTFDCLKQIKRKKKRENEWANAMINHSLNEPIEPPTNKSHEKIDQVIRLLPPRQKKVYNLRTGGMKQIEIAQELNISVGTVKKHMTLAMRFLKSQLKN
jgi:RNA polymerase sigma-70 factor (ECF subfamily)